MTSTDTGATVPARALNERLDSLPFTRQHTKLLVGSGLGWALDAMDVGLISFILVQLNVQWGLTAPERSWIATAGFVGMAIGASLGGLLADKIGRRQVFAVTLLVYGLATGASALSWGVASLVLLRLLVGLGLGAELPVASTLVSEFAPPKIRGRVIVFLEAFWAVGWTVAALVGFYVVPAGENGWRWAFVIGAIPAAYALVVRRGLPESVRFLQSKGRHAEAEAVVVRFETAAGVESVKAAPVVESVVAETSIAPAVSVSSLFRGGMGKRTAAIWAVWFFVNFAYYGAFTWLPTILVNDGASVTKSLQYTLIITLAQLPGYACAGILIEKWGRRGTLALFLIGSAVAAGLFSQADGPSKIIAFGMLLSFFNLGAWGALYAVTPEIYPTVLRGTGSGWAAGFGRVASIVTTLTVPLLHEATGTGMVFGLFAGVFLLAAVSSFFLPEMRGQTLAEE